ncbi:MAG: hypothetical protein SWY16_01445 [Cyanobacteriota bacterium]|nr:hypothetical protein [Cyanobacteriota bacterium]
MLQVDGESDRKPKIGDATSPLMADDPPHSPDGRNLVRILVVGSPSGVEQTIRTLYVLGFAQMSDWSPLLPTPHSGDVMSILTRQIGQ